MRINLEFSELIRLPPVVAFGFAGKICSCLPELSVYGQILPVAFGCPVVIVVLLNGQRERVGESRVGGGPRASGQHYSTTALLYSL
jgi:hypothetical protein